MVLAYLDTSAAMKLVIDEAESAAMETLIWDEDRVLASSWLLHTELHCAVARREGLGSALIDAVLGMTRLAEVQRADLIAAAGFERLRTNDAIHLATAVRIEAQEMITYDEELAAAAARVGLHVLSPGSDLGR
ncbi:type II toxin-antitoxin system VapC family toxin [Microbacterium aerolatum]|uniref:type II toxin-antitoxin system VapC family toxin n=1 Tax=Microbacterium aerolatum TaxID=153731 RepID=UPI00384FC72E